mgnify:CR=1 FL=1
MPATGWPLPDLTGRPPGRPLPGPGSRPQTPPPTLPQHGVASQTLGWPPGTRAIAPDCACQRRGIGDLGIGCVVAERSRACGHGQIRVERGRAIGHKIAQGRGACQEQVIGDLGR